MKKRNSRAIPVLDLDDLKFLKLIKNGKKIPISKVINKLEISHKGFLTHRNRLKKFGLIECFRGEKDYKNKYLKIKSNGLLIIQIFQDG